MSRLHDLIRLLPLSADERAELRQEITRAGLGHTGLSVSIELRDLGPIIPLGPDRFAPPRYEANATLMLDGQVLTKLKEQGHGLIDTLALAAGNAGASAGHLTEFRADATSEAGSKLVAKHDQPMRQCFNCYRWMPCREGTVCGSCERDVWRGQRADVVTLDGHIGMVSDSGERHLEGNRRHEDAAEPWK